MEVLLKSIEIGIREGVLTPAQNNPVLEDRYQF